MRSFARAVLGAVVSVIALATAIESPSAGAAATPAMAGVDSPVAVRQAALDGSLSHSHHLISLCSGNNDGGYLPTGCDLSLIASSSNAAKPLAASGPVGLGPADFARAFHLPDAPGQTGTIGIVGFGATPTLAADLATYRSEYGLPACTEASGCLKIVGQNGGAPPAPLGPLFYQAEQALATESTIDVDMASAACPSCQIRVVELSSVLAIPNYAYLPAVTAKAVDDGADTAIGLGANAVSISYNIANSLQPGIATDVLAQRLHHPGIAMVASAGDHGVQQGTANQTWPQELPWVTSAGGFQLTSTDRGQTFNISAWNSGTGEAGWYWSAAGACSSFIAPAIG